MLFDLRGKRKRVVQVSYALLAAIFLVGFVGFVDRRRRTRREASSTLSGWAETAAAASLSSSVRRPDRQRQRAAGQGPEGHRGAAEALQVRVLQGEEGDHRIPPPAAHRQRGRPHGARQGGRRLGEVPQGQQGRAERQDRRSDGAGVLLPQRRQGAAEAQRIVAEDQPSSGSLGRARLLPVRRRATSRRRQAAKKAVAEAPKAQRSQIKAAARPDPEAGREAEEAAGEGAEERAVATTPGQTRSRARSAAPAPRPRRPATPSLPSRPPGR